ncbi:MAG: hypothetical protein WCB31_02035 [Nitrososphaeraceae archaeon]
MISFSSLLLSTVLIISSICSFGGFINPAEGQEQEEIEPIPPVNITNQTTSQVSSEMDNVPDLS